MELLTRQLERTYLEGGWRFSIDKKEIKQVTRDVRLVNGFAPNDAKLLTAPTANSKLAKSGLHQYALSLSPHQSSHIVNVCEHSTPSCRAGCVAFSGQGAYPTVQRGRTWKVDMLTHYPNHFICKLYDELRAAERRHKGEQVYMRLNAFSDLRWELFLPELFRDFEDVRFYDYTKYPLGTRGHHLPDNYRLTYSATAEMYDDGVQARWNASKINFHTLIGENVAVVFKDVKRDEPFGPTWHGMPVIDGDKTDDRWNDPRGVIVALRAKGKMRNPKNKMPFVWAEGV